jgi:flagellar protein FlaG
VKDIAMIIQNTSHMNQAVQPSVRAYDTTPTKTAAVSPLVQNAPVQASQVSLQELKSAVMTINHAMQQTNLNLQFSVDTDTAQTVVRMVDTSTGEMIRQFPSEATLAILRGIEQFQQGLLLNQKA